jgi:Family of unknown function (DUF6188)
VIWHDRGSASLVARSITVRTASSRGPSSVSTTSCTIASVGVEVVVGQVVAHTSDLPPRDARRIDHQARLQFQEVEVIIENAFSLEIGAEHYDLDAEARASLGPLLSLYPSTLQSASLDDDGTLHLSFDNASS